MSREDDVSLIHSVEHATSTQDVLHALAAEGAPAGTAVVAATQSEGRGSRGRQWRSPLGGLWLSVLLRPARPVGLEVLSLRVGLATADVLATMPGLPPVELKWPNDLMIRDHKVGGILCEARWQGDRLGWVTVGIGLNVANRLPDDPATPAARLTEYCPTLRPDVLVKPIAAAALGVALDQPFLDPVELAAFAARDWLRGRTLRAPVAGRCTRVAADGALIVGTPDGEREVRTGSVVLADDRKHT